MIGVTALVVGAATASDRVACVANLVAGACTAAVVVLLTAVRLLRPTAVAARTDGAESVRALATMARDQIAAYDTEARRHERALAQVADLLERRAWWMTGIATLGLLVSAPLWLTQGADGLVAGACGTVALLLVALGPLAGIGVCMVALLGEWGPPLLTPPGPGHPDAARALAARRLAATVVGELVVARRRQVVALVGWLLAGEVLLLAVITATRIGTL